jgi:AbrB family looped-hinge helix DNA binding protein
METRIDSSGRVVVPKPLRDALGLTAESTMDISRYGAGLQLLPVGRTARRVEESGALVATADIEIDDDVVFGLIGTRRSLALVGWPRGCAQCVSRHCCLSWSQTLVVT